MDGRERRERRLRAYTSLRLSFGRALRDVSRDGYALATIASHYAYTLRSAIVLAAVTQNGKALRYAEAECKADREIVLAAVQQTWRALEYAAEECKADREIMLAAVQQDGDALKYAAEDCKADHEIVQAAVQQDRYAIQYAADELLLDVTFAPEAKRGFYMLKVSLLSGRSTVVMSDGDNNAETIIEHCCRRLTIHESGKEPLIHGTEVLPATAQVRSWPGLRSKGEVSEYQLVMGAQ
eukprot:3385612-Amphidinium_carterae.1